MSKLVKFTNILAEHRGNPIWINVDHITAIYEAADVPGGSLRTVIYGGLQGTAWTVEEGLGEVIKIINGEKK